MSGNSFGKQFCVTTFGESHGTAVGCVIDGCPSGVPLAVETINEELARRRPGAGASSTTRSEPDEAELLSGVYEGATLGTPIAIIIRNKSQRSGDYESLRSVYRPGHADFCYDAKYGRRDHRGGGRSSGRETAGRVAAGAVAKAFLSLSGVTVTARVEEAAGLPPEKLYSVAEELRAAGDSAGGIIACRVENLPAGIGEPVFDKLDALLGSALFSIGAVKGVEIGAGFGAAGLRGSSNNDPLICAKGKISFAGNNSGGVLGGISNGMPLEIRVAFKPVPSISTEQQSVDAAGNSVKLSVKGRHDVCVCPRAVPVVEAMTALVLADLLLRNRCSRV